jgi:hypothetical protein
VTTLSGAAVAGPQHRWGWSGTTGAARSPSTGPPAILAGYAASLHRGDREADDLGRVPRGRPADIPGARRGVDGALALYDATGAPVLSAVAELSGQLEAVLAALQRHAEAGQAIRDGALARIAAAETDAETARQAAAASEAARAAEARRAAAAVANKEQAVEGRRADGARRRKRAGPSSERGLAEGGRA